MKKKLNSGILLLAVIYLAFISLGLPDTAFGVAWPSIRKSLDLPLYAAGIFSIMITIGTAISSFSSGYVLGKLGTGKVIFISCVMTGTALLCYSFVPNLIWLLILTIPLGFGGGSVDTGLNNYVANNYSAKHMSWLHCFWGVGASIGPNIMALLIDKTQSWRWGYFTIGITQLCIAVVLFISLPLWKKQDKASMKKSEDIAEHEKVEGLKILREKGVIASIMAFPIYVVVESGLGLWLASYLIEGRDVSQINAGIIVATYYGSITVGRFLSGILTRKLSNKQLIRLGIIIILIGLALLVLPYGIFIVPSVILIGLGCAPIYPSMIHDTPKRFGSVNSQTITGYQVGMGYVGGTVITPLVGLLATKVTIHMIPISAILFAIGLLVITERLNRLADV